MNVEYINPFIEASQTVLKTAANIDISLGKIHLKTSSYLNDTVVIIIGLMGMLKGQVILSLSNTIACKLASEMMMGMPVYELDDVSKSAISEIANMILGNSATLLFKKGIKIDITPPSILQGDNLEFTAPKTTTICIPLNLSTGGTIELDIAVME